MNSILQLFVPTVFHESVLVLPLQWIFLLQWCRCYMFICWPFYLFASINHYALVNIFFALVVYKKVLLVFFSTLNVVFSEHFCFSTFIGFNKPFYIYASVNFSTSLNFFALVVQCGVLRFCVGILFYYVFSTLSPMNFYVSMPLLASMKFSTFLLQ